MAEVDAFVEMFAERACAKLVHEYARLADGDDVNGFGDLFAQTAVWERADGVVIVGREAIREAYSSRRRSGTSRHQLLGVSVDFLGPGRAEGFSTALVFKSADSNGKQVHILSYADKYEQGETGRWVIAARSSEVLATHTMAES